MSTDPFAEGKIKKEVILAGTGAKPQDGNRVKGTHSYYCSLNDLWMNSLVLYSITAEDGTVVAKNDDKQRPFKFRLGSDQVIKGFELAVLGMQVGEKSKFLIDSSYAYDEAGLEGFIKPNTPITLEVTLLDVEDSTKTRWELDENERISLTLSMKNDGNDLFKSGSLQEARNTYREAFKMIEYDSGEKFSELKISLLLNIALVSNKLKEYLEGISAATQALDINEMNAKALYRRASSRQGLVQYEEAIADLNEALGFEPDNQDIKNELVKVKEAIAKQKAKEKEFYGQMFK